MFFRIELAMNLVKGSIGMQKKIVLVILCFLNIIAFDCLWAKANPVRAQEQYRFKINFGKARPIESLIIDRNLSIKTNPGEDLIKVDFSSYLDNQKGEHIHFNRLKLAINDRIFDLDKGPFEVEPKTFSPDDKLFLTFSLNLTPSDYPGSYQGSITFQTSHKKITFQLEVEVQPWVRMETDQKLIGLEQVTKEDLKLFSPIPLTIRVASNTNWVLSVNLARDIKVPIQLKLGQQQHNDIQSFFQSGGSLEIGKKPLAAGNSTVRSCDSYWLELPIAVFIDEFYKYPAGKQLFQIRFLLELWDQKTVRL